jgi:hypothetical protein
MAEWKKVIVSGSAAVLSQLNVGTNQQITTSQATTFLTGSFTGSFTGNGANLTGVTATAVFPTSQTTSILSTTKLFSNDGGNTFVYVGQVTASAYAGVSGDITIGTDGVAAIGSGKVTSAMIVDGTIVGGDIASATVANANLVNSSITIGSTSTALGATSTTLAGLTSVTSTTFVGSLTGTATTASFVLQAVSASFASTAALASTVTTNANLTGNVTSVGNATTIASGVVTSDMITNDTIVNADINSAAAIVYTKLNLASSGIVSGSTLAAGSGQGSTTLTTNGVSSGDITATGLGTAGTPQFAGATLTGNLAINNSTSTAITTTGTTAAVFNTTATTVNAFGAATTLNMGASTGTTTVNNNLSVLGTLYVQGPVTAISSSNLYVADQFILLASGSTNNTDGGIVIDRGAYASGNIAYGFDSTTGRWGYQNNVVDTSNTLDPASGGNGLSGSFAGIVFTEAAHSATKPTTGEFAQAGAIYTNTDGTIWMYA